MRVRLEPARAKADEFAEEKLGEEDAEEQGPRAHVGEAGAGDEDDEGGQVYPIELKAAGIAERHGGGDPEYGAFVAQGDADQGGDGESDPGVLVRTHGDEAEGREAKAGAWV